MFFDIESASGGLDDRWENGVRMHQWDRVKNIKYEENCNFTFIMRKPDGSPYRTQALIGTPFSMDDDEQKPSNRPEPPTIQAVEWTDDGCKLSNGWFYWPTPEGNFYKNGLEGDWEDKDLPIPEGVDENCPEIAIQFHDAESSKLFTRDSSEPKVEVVVLKDEIDEFVEKAALEGYQGFSKPLSMA
ncbi:hypothetical protein CDD81_5216 [Ophiocordyceps australis]|uniref:Uncharacterized protein n=1 Tax=Ophiocordyceps australis TaxID=1399860 RepID=A0A2C5YIQ8_9HYPO|nr:hypothetical protein CDD81_5216 [Ophiocordyceps australis]